MKDRLVDTSHAFQKPEWYFQKLGYHVRVRIETVAEFLDGARFNRILDIGCGDGSISLPLLTEENHLTLLDLSEGMLARARSRIPVNKSNHVEIVKGDFISSHLNGYAYDLILCIGVLAYVDPLQPFLEKLTFLLKPGGRLIIEWTNGDHFVSHLFRPYHRLINVFVPPKVQLTPHGSEDILGRLRGLGCESVGTYQYCSPLPVLRRLLSEDCNYTLIRMMHGSVKHNRATWLGEECIYQFIKMPAQEPVI